MPEDQYAGGQEETAAINLLRNIEDGNSESLVKQESEHESKSHERPKPVEPEAMFAETTQ